MNIRKILYALPPRITARMIAFVTAFALTAAGVRVAYGFTEVKSGGKNDESETESAVTDKEQEGDTDKSVCEAFQTEGAASIGAVISAQNALLCNLSEGKITAEKNMQGVTEMLDISIFMTAIISSKAISDEKISTSDFAVCPASAAKKDGYGLSADVLPIGKRMKISELIRCMFYQRGSSYAYTLAVHISGSEDAFVSEMNAEAARLGLKNTVFTSCTGSGGDGGKTTAYDTAVVLKELLGIPYLRDMFFSSERLEVTHSQAQSVKLVVANDFFQSYCTESQARLDGILGGKVSGEGSGAWSVVAFKNGNTEYLAIIIGSSSPFSDALMLYSAYALCQSSQ